MLFSDVLPLPRSSGVPAAAPGILPAGLRRDALQVRQGGARVQGHFAPFIYYLFIYFIINFFVFLFFVC